MIDAVLGVGWLAGWLVGQDGEEEGVVCAVCYSFLLLPSLRPTLNSTATCIFFTASSKLDCVLIHLDELFDTQVHYAT